MHILSDIHGSPREPDLREVDDRALLWPEVKHQTGLSRTTAWRMERRSEFPARVQLSPGRVGWWESEVSAWKMSRRLVHLTSTARGRGRPRGARAADSTADASEPLSPSAVIATIPEEDLAPDQSAEGAAVKIPGHAVQDVPEAVPTRPARRSSRISPGQMGFDF